MKTAVQLHDAHEELRSELLWPAQQKTRRGRLGPVVLVGPDEIVAYVLRPHGRRPHLFVFRTLNVDDILAASVPGVCPRVRLLLELRTAGRVRLVRALFTYLANAGRSPSRLADGFYVRLGVVLAGRLPARQTLRSFVDRDKEL